MNATASGTPIGRAAEVNIRNNHMQYIITWFVPPALAQYLHYPTATRPQLTILSNFKVRPDFCDIHHALYARTKAPWRHRQQGKTEQGLGLGPQHYSDFRLRFRFTLLRTGIRISCDNSRGRCFWASENAVVCTLICFCLMTVRCKIQNCRVNIPSH